MLGKRFEILSYAICKISFECYASVWHAIYESAILLGLINNTLGKTKWICKSEHYLFRVHGKTKWNFHGFFSFENVTKILLLHGTIKTAL